MKNLYNIKKDGKVGRIIWSVQKKIMEIFDIVTKNIIPSFYYFLSIILVTIFIFLSVFSYTQREAGLTYKEVKQVKECKNLLDLVNNGSAVTVCMDKSARGLFKSEKCLYTNTLTNDKQVIAYINYKYNTRDTERILEKYDKFHNEHN